MIFGEVWWWAQNWAHCFTCHQCPHDQMAQYHSARVPSRFVTARTTLRSPSPCRSSVPLTDAALRPRAGRGLRDDIFKSGFEPRSIARAPYRLLFRVYAPCVCRARFGGSPEFRNQTQILLVWHQYLCRNHFRRREKPTEQQRCRKRTNKLCGNKAGSVGWADS